MTEELNQGAAGVEGVAGDVVPPGQPDTTPTTEPVAGKSEKVEIPAEYTTLIEQQVQTATDALREEFEGEGGHVSKIKSVKDKEIAKLNRQLQEQQEAGRKRALDLMDSDPAEAARQFEAQNKVYVEQQQYQQYQDQMGAYVDKTLEEYGLDAEDAEIAKSAAEWTQRLMQDEKLGADFQHAMGQLRLEQKDEQVTQLQKQLDAQQEEIPKLITQGIARAMESAGIGDVDLSPGGPSGKSGSVHGKYAAANVKDGIDAARKEMQRKAQ